MFFNKSQKKVGLAFDIGTASVSAALFELRGDDPRPHVLKVFRKFYTASLKRDASHFSKSTVGQFSAILKDVDTELKGVMPEIYVIGLSSIFYLGKTEHIYEKRPKPRVVTQADTASFINQGQQKFLADIGHGDVVIIEEVLMRSFLNGYRVDQPTGKSAEEIESWIHFAGTSRELYDTFTSVIKSSRPDAKIRFSTFPITTWLLMQELLAPEHSAIIVDIGGELTEVTFLVDGVITEIVSLPFGVLNILLRISELERIDLDNALSLLKAYTGNTLTPEASAKLRGIIKKEMKSWEEVFERIWQRAARDIMSDVKMLFLGGGALVGDMKLAVAPPLLHPDLARGLHVSVIQPEAFQDKFGTFGAFDGPGDFGLMSLIASTRYYT